MKKLGLVPCQLHCSVSSHCSSVLEPLRILVSPVAVYGKHGSGNLEAGSYQAKCSLIQISNSRYIKPGKMPNEKKTVLEKAVSYKVRNKGKKKRHVLGISDYSGSGIPDIKRKSILREVFT